MKKFSLALDLILVWAAIGSLVAMMLLTVFSSFGRYFLNSPIPDDLVLNEMLIVPLVFLPLAYVQRQKAHVAVTLFTDGLSRRGIKIFESISYVLGVIFLVIITGATTQEFLSVWEVGAYKSGRFSLPEWPARLVVCVGLFLFTLRMLTDLISNIRQLRNNELDQ